jgi:hypothetical protein
MPIEHSIINMYCCVVDEYNALIKNPQMLRRRGYAPKLTDAEVIAMELVGEFLSLDTDKGIWRYFKHHWSNWFPNLGSRANFAKQSSHLWFVKQLILGRITNRLGTVMEAIHLVDGFQGQVLVGASGAIMDFTLTAANTSTSSVQV